VFSFHETEVAALDAHAHYTQELVSSYARPEHAAQRKQYLHVRNLQKLGVEAANPATR
jgi:hypothetical protein